MPEFTVLVVGATGSIGRHVVSESLRRGYGTRALIRDPSRRAVLPADVQPAVGDLTRADTLTDAVKGVDGVVFTHGSRGGARDAEQVDYGAVRNVFYNEPDQQRLVMLQGDRRWASDPSDGVVSRAQIALVLVASVVAELESVRRRSSSA